MKAITLYEPWASLAALMEKEYETRSWSIRYRGTMAIHAGKREPKGYEFTDRINKALFSQGHYEMHLGSVIAIADLVDCILMTPEFIASVSAKERAFGDWDEGRFAWKLANVRRIDPVPAKGMQGLWNWDSPYLIKAG